MVHSMRAANNKRNPFQQVDWQIDHAHPQMFLLFRASAMGSRMAESVFLERRLIRLFSSICEHGIALFCFNNKRVLPHFDDRITEHSRVLTMEKWRLDAARDGATTTLLRQFATSHHHLERGRPARRTSNRYLHRQGAKNAQVLQPDSTSLAFLASRR